MPTIKKEEGNFVNSDGAKLNYSKFSHNEPNNYHNEDCLVGGYYQNDLWNDLSCLVKGSVICYKTNLNASNKSLIMTPKGTFLLSPQSMTIKRAQSFCEEEGLHLLEIRDIETNNMIFKLANEYRLGKYWIGNSQLRSELTFTTSANNKITFDRSQKSECIYEKNGLERNYTASFSIKKYDPSKLQIRRITPYDFQMMFGRKSSYWDYTDCKSKYSVICV